MDDAQCMICGRDATINRHLGMVCKAFVKLGESPNKIFWTRTFSKICKTIMRVERNSITPFEEASWPAHLATLFDLLPRQAANLG